jgi:hypothetical protein
MNPVYIPDADVDPIAPAVNRVRTLRQLILGSVLAGEMDSCAGLLFG